MGILVNKNTRVIVQGITGKEGQFHTKQMLDYGTKVVGGVTPGKGGTRVLDLPVFNSVQEAVSATQADASVIFVPPPYAADGIFESIAAGIKIIVCITEGIPVHDMMKVYRAVKENKVFLIGPNCPGITTAGEAKLGIIPGKIFKPGNIGVISRSGTLTYEIVNVITETGLGESTVLGIGGDKVPGMSFIDVLKLFEEDKQTKGIVIVGEIGGSEEEKAADFIRKNVKKPVFAFIDGLYAPPGKRMGHAGAIISGNVGTAKSKLAAFKKANVPVAKSFNELSNFIIKGLG